MPSIQSTFAKKADALPWKTLWCWSQSPGLVSDVIFHLQDQSEKLLSGLLLWRILYAWNSRIRKRRKRNKQIHMIKEKSVSFKKRQKDKQGEMDKTTTWWFLHWVLFPKQLQEMKKSQFPRWMLQNCTWALIVSQRFKQSLTFHISRTLHSCNGLGSIFLSQKFSNKGV